MINCQMLSHLGLIMYQMPRVCLEGGGGGGGGDTHGRNRLSHYLILQPQVLAFYTPTTTGQRVNIILAFKKTF